MNPPFYSDLSAATGVPISKYKTATLSSISKYSFLCLALVSSLFFGLSRQNILAELSENGGAAPSVRAEKLIIAHLMHQMSVGAEHALNESTAAAPPSLPNGTLAQYHADYIKNYRKPLLAARQDIAVARNAGVNTFSLLLGPNHLPGSQFATIIHAYFQAAAERNDFKICPDIWWSGKADDPAVERLAEALKILADNYDAVWPRMDGRRVILWNTMLKSTEILDKVLAKIGGLDAVYLVLYTPQMLKEKSPELFTAADAFTCWPHSCYSDAIRAVDINASAAKSAGKPFWYPVMPAFAQSRSNGNPPPIPNVREKLGMVNFIADWQHALSGNAQAVCLQTWNDLTEDSAVGPEANHDYAYCELNKYFAKIFQEGEAPPTKDEQILLFHHPQVVDKIGLPIDRQAMGALGGTATPPTDYVGVVAMLKDPAKVAVMFGDKILAEREFDRGMSSWLIYHPAEMASPDGYPTTTEALAVTTLNAPFWDAELYVAVSRKNEKIGFFRSHRPVVDHAGRGELTTIGDVFKIEPCFESSSTAPPNSTMSH